MNRLDIIKSNLAGVDHDELMHLASRASADKKHEIAISYYLKIKNLLQPANIFSKTSEAQRISYLLAESFRKIGKLDEAETEINIAYSINPNNEATLLNYAWIKMDKMEFEEAIELLTGAVNLNPKESRGYFYRGACYRQIEKWEHALSDLNKSAEIDPTAAECHYNIGNIYHQMEEYERAIGKYNEAIALDPLYSKSYVSRGNCRIELGRMVLASQDFQIALNLGDNRVIENNGKYC